MKVEINVIVLYCIVLYCIVLMLRNLSSSSCRASTISSLLFFSIALFIHVMHISLSAACPGIVLVCPASILLRLPLPRVLSDATGRILAGGVVTTAADGFDGPADGSSG